MAISKYLSIVILNVNGLIAPTERHRMAAYIKIQCSSICSLQETQI